MGIYPRVAMFNHSCQANAVLVKMDSSTLDAKRIVALHDIQEGTEISINYIHPKVMRSPTVIARIRTSSLVDRTTTDVYRSS